MNVKTMIFLWFSFRADFFYAFEFVSNKIITVQKIVQQANNCASCIDNWATVSVHRKTWNEIETDGNGKQNHRLSLFLIEQKTTILFTVRGSRFESLWMTIRPAATNCRSRLDGKISKEISKWKTVRKQKIARRKICGGDPRSNFQLIRSYVVL